MKTQTVECVQCELRSKVDDPIVELVHQKYGVWVCSNDCGSDYIYNEFKYMIESNWGVHQ